MSSKGQIVIPLDMRKDINEGDRLIVIKNDDEIIIKKTLPESAILSEKSLSEAWLSEEDEKAFKYLQK
jgi:AbrB family looped-hinge helix DNA binding protein